MPKKKSDSTEFICIPFHVQHLYFEDLHNRVERFGSIKLMVIKLENACLRSRQSGMHIWECIYNIVIRSW